jgi:hypothetical protein
MSIYTPSYKPRDVDETLVISFLVETPFTTLRVVLVQKGLNYHLQENGPHLHMIQMFGRKMLTWLYICSIPLTMTCHNILRVIFSYPLGIVMHILLSIFNHFHPQS